MSTSRRCLQSNVINSTITEAIDDIERVGNHLRMRSGLSASWKGITWTRTASLTLQTDVLSSKHTNDAGRWVWGYLTFLEICRTVAKCTFQFNCNTLEDIYKLSVGIRGWSTNHQWSLNIGQLNLQGIYKLLVEIELIINKTFITICNFLLTFITESFINHEQLTACGWFKKMQLNH